MNKDNTTLKNTYNKIFKDGEENFFTFSSYDESLAILNFLPNVQGKKILEIGCGQGALASMLACAGANVTAIDYSEQVIGLAQAKYNIPNLKFVCKDFNDVSDKYDLVVLQGVLEHFDEPFESLKKIMSELVTIDGMVLTSSPSFLNPRGYVWMTLQLLLDVPMSLSDLHFLCPFDFEEFCAQHSFRLEYLSSDQSWGNGDGMLVDFDKRLRNALADANLNNNNVDKLLEFLRKASRYSQLENHTGANVVYKIQHK